MVHGPQGQLTLVFQNLLSNSLKYRNQEKPPRIEVSTRQELGHGVTCVQDNGIGFEPQYAKPMYFGLFKRLHKDQYPGTGLGLTICQRTVERYGGRMWAEGIPQEGPHSTSRFLVLTRPRREAKATGLFPVANRFA